VSLVSVPVPLPVTQVINPQPSAQLNDLPELPSPPSSFDVCGVELLRGDGVEKNVPVSFTAQFPAPSPIVRSDSGSDSGSTSGRLGIVKSFPFMPSSIGLNLRASGPDHPHRIIGQGTLHPSYSKLLFLSWYKDCPTPSKRSLPSSPGVHPVPVPFVTLFSDSDIVFLFAYYRRSASQQEAGSSGEPVPGFIVSCCKVKETQCLLSCSSFRFR
jgi:hypothetical protein